MNKKITIVAVPTIGTTGSTGTTSQDDLKANTSTSR